MTKRETCKHCGGGAVDLQAHEESCVMQISMAEDEIIAIAKQNDNQYLLSRQDWKNKNGERYKICARLVANGRARWLDIKSFGSEGLGEAGPGIRLLGQGTRPSLLELAQQAAVIYRCNCDLDNWEPNQDTGHSPVCRIDATARRWYTDGVPTEF